MEKVSKVLTNMLTSEYHSEICPDCGVDKYMEIELAGSKKYVRKQCVCEKNEYEKHQEEDRRKQKQIRLERLREYSMMDAQFESCTFEKFEVDEHNQKIFKMALNYCENWEQMKKENVGFMLWGTPGNGKTYVASCIANHLINELVPVIAISTIGLLGRIKRTYNSYGREGEAEILATLNNASLLVLDDLGAENNTNWVKEKLYEIIDTRYRQSKPTIITTNLSPIQLKNKLTGDDEITRTYDRLVEICPPIELKGYSKRAKSAKKKVEILKGLME